MFQQSQNHLNPQPVPPDRKAICPTCGRRANFSFGGVQHWPAKVAKAAGIAPTVRLWQCDNCNTTVSEQEIQ